MPQKHLLIKPGVDTQSSALANGDQWTLSSLIRFRDGWLETIRGWRHLCATPLSGVCRALHYWVDLSKNNWLAAGTNSNLYLVDDAGVLHDITPIADFTPGNASSDVGVPFTLQNWTLDNFGERLIATAYGQGIFVWQPPDPTVEAVLIPQAPPFNQGAFLVMPPRIIMAYGSSLDDGDQDPLLVRWCDQENYGDWTASTTNQAGSFRLSRGSRIVGGLQAGITSLLWTDVDLWVVQYIGFPLVFSFLQASSQCGLIGQNAAVAFAGSVFWLSENGLFQWSGQGVTKLPCSVWDVFIRNINFSNKDKCVAGIDGRNSEVWFFFPADIDESGEINAYLKYNVLEKVWDYGTSGSPNLMSRTAWSEKAGSPISVDLSNLIQEQEVGLTADGDPITDCSVRSGFIDLADGDNPIFVDQFIPDFMWEGDDPEILVSLYFREYPGDPSISMGPFSVTPTTKSVTLRLPRTVTVGGSTVTAYPAVRAREVAIQINSVSGWWRWGMPRLRVIPLGREP